MKIFVSCVSQKHGNIRVDISQINQPTLESTFELWEGLTTIGGKPSCNVYKGIQWELIKQLSNLVDVKVISGGYGIIDLDTPIVPYSITLSSAYIENRHLTLSNFNIPQKEANKKWFNMFGDFSHYWDTDETLILTVNPDYLEVLNIPQKDNIILLTNYKLGILAKWLKSGVNNVAVNFALYLAKSHPNLSGNTELRQIYDDLVLKYGKQLYPKRNKVDDQFIIDWVRSGKTLRYFRDSGYACSVQRYNKIRDGVKSGN